MRTNSTVCGQAMSELCRDGRVVVGTEHAVTNSVRRGYKRWAGNETHTIEQSLEDMAMLRTCYTAPKGRA